MKKFLFTLAALLMASSAFALNVYIPDTEFTKDQLGTQVWLPVYVQLDNEYINGWDISFTYPENLEVTPSIRKNAAVLTQTAVTDEWGSTESVSFTVNGNSTQNVGACLQGGYWDPDGDGEYEMYGAVKIGPTGDFMLYEIRVQPTEAFTGGNIVIHWMLSGGFDKRNGQGVGSNPLPSKETETTVALTVKDDAQPAPVPTFREADGMLYAECANHEVVLMDAEGNVLPNPYELPANTSYTEALVLNFKAYTKANADESGNSAEVTYQTTIPALDKNDVDSPSIQGMTGENGTYYIIIAPAVLGKGLEVEWEADPTTSNYTVDENGIVTLIYNRGAEDVPVYVLASTKATTEYNASDVADATITVPALPQVKTPKINYVVNGDGTFTVTATCDTEGATIVLKDKDGNIVDNPATVNYDPYVGYNGTWTATATAPYYRPSETGSQLIEIGATDKIFVDSPSIVGMSDEDGLHFTITIIPGTTDGQLIYSAEPMGTLMRAATVNIQYERKAEDYYVDVDAYTTEGATYAESAHETAHVRVPALPQTAKPSVTYSYENGKLTVWAYGSDDDAVYTLYCDGEKYTGEMPISYDIYEGYGPHTWTATAIAPNKLESEVSDPVEITIDEESKVYYTPAPVIGEPVVTAENVTFTVTGQGTVTVTVTTSEGTKTYTSEEGSVTVVLPRGEEYDMAIVNATAEANEVPDGYDAVAPGRVGPEYIDIPALVYSEAPVIVPTPGKSEWDEEGNQTYDGHYVVVTFEAVDGAEIYYSMDGEHFEKWDGTPIYFRNNGDYTVYAYAVEPGKMPSAVKDEPIHVDESTSVNGLVNGKTVAGVRYFNMAGQEMQEANGVTIVVTTYTDGTTSAVKVIK